MKISFKCDKDPVLAEHYDKTFRENFELDIEETGYDILQLLAIWNPQMRDEALIQEHWDFDEVDGKRKPVLGDDGRPTLLVPTIVFE
jgi:hypothetical protein